MRSLPFSEQNDIELIPVWSFLQSDQTHIEIKDAIATDKTIIKNRLEIKK